MAPKLRGHIDKQFANPRQARADKFVWDYWHIENQYSLLRTPALHYFPKDLYQKFYSKLLELAQFQFGCAMVSSPWLSCYTDGCFQNLHADVPQGPWAFVYSLTNWEQRTFKGGETLMIKPDILKYWEKPIWQKGLEVSDIFEEVAPEFNQLLVFDPRIPHGVKRVEGEKNPMNGRLVIHGWFMDPCPFVHGGLESHKNLEGFLSNEVAQVVAHASEGTNPLGFLSLRLDINASGSVAKILVLASSILDSSVVVPLKKNLKLLKFPKASKSSQLILPLLFE